MKALADDEDWIEGGERHRRTGGKCEEMGAAVTCISCSKFDGKLERISSSSSCLIILLNEKDRIFWHKFP
jgi:hypothetical protein